MYATYSATGMGKCIWAFSFTRSLRQQTLRIRFRKVRHSVDYLNLFATMSRQRNFVVTFGIIDKFPKTDGEKFFVSDIYGKRYFLNLTEERYPPLTFSVNS